MLNHKIHLRGLILTVSLPRGEEAMYMKNFLFS